MSDPVVVGSAIATEPRANIDESGQLTIGVYNEDTDTVDELLRFDSPEVYNTFIEGVAREVIDAVEEFEQLDN